MFPFLWQGIKTKETKCFAYNGEYCYAGMSGDGQVIRSKNRFHWEKYLETEDYAANALYVRNGFLFVGTAPNGNMLRVDLSDDTFEAIYRFESPIVKFFEINSTLFIATVRNVYRYDDVSYETVLVYEAYGNITDVYCDGKVATVALDKENIIEFNGEEWTLMQLGKDNVSSFRNVSLDPFSKISYDFIKRESVANKSLNVEDYMTIVPFNKEAGLGSIARWNDMIVGGGLNYSRLFGINSTEKTTNILFDTDGSGVHSILPIDTQTILASMGNSLYMGYYGRLINPTTQTTKTVTTRTYPDEKTRWYFVKIMDMDDEHITSMSKDDHFLQIILGTSKGRILATDMVKINAYATGSRMVYGYSKNEYGIRSNDAKANILYSLYNRLVEVSSQKSVDKWKFSRMATVSGNEKIYGVFISPILNIRNDFGMWNTLIWEEVKSENSNIRIFVKAASSIEKLYNQDWQFGFESTSLESGTITRNLNNIKLNGNYLQIKVEMDSQDNADMLSKIMIEYSTKNASYFFTTNFQMNVDEVSTRGFVTANISKPVNTEVFFGITDKNTTDWNDYQVVDTDTFFDMENFSNLKMGIKFVSYDDSLPVVSEFSLIRNK